MHEVLVNRLGGLSLPRKSVVRLTDRPDMTLDVYRGRKTTKQQQQQIFEIIDPPYSRFTKFPESGACVTKQNSISVNLSSQHMFHVFCLHIMQIRL